MESQPDSRSHFLNKFGEWSSKTTWHGVADLSYFRSNLARVLWLFVLFATMLSCCAQIYTSVNDYVHDDNPWIRTPTYILETEMELPGVMVCSNNRVSKLSLKLLNMSEDAAGIIMDAANVINKHISIESQSADIHKRQAQAFQQHLQQYPERVDLGLNGWAELLAPTCEQLLLFVDIGGQQGLTSSERCKTASKYYNRIAGQCFYIEPTQNGTVYKQRTASSSEGMTLNVMDDIADYAYVYETRLVDRGLIIFIGYDPASTFVTPPILTTAATHQYVTMKRSTNKPPTLQLTIPFWNLLEPSAPCSDIVSKLDTIKGTFSESMCDSDCLAAGSYEYCGCIPFLVTVQDEKKTPICTPIETLKCWDEKLSKLKFISSMECLSKCYLPLCTRSMVNIGSLSSAISPANPEFDAKKIKEFDKDRDGEIKVQNQSKPLQPIEEIIKQSSRITLYFESMSVEVMQPQQKTSSQSLVGFVGGQLGLWAGISVITLLQMITYSFTAVLDYFSGKAQVDKIHKPAPSIQSTDILTRKLASIPSSRLHRIYLDDSKYQWQRRY